MTRVTASLMVLTGASLMSFVGLILRNIDEADAFQILFYRSFALTLMVMVVACVRRRVGPINFFMSLDWLDVVMGLLLGLAFSFYVYALMNTSIASGLFILSSSPVFATILNWAVVGEKPSKYTLIAIGMALLGVGIMVADGIEGGGLLGNFYALLSAFGFACMLVLIRYYKREDALGGTFVGGIVAMLMNEFIAVGIGSGLIISYWDFGLSIFMGAFTIGLGMALVTWAAGYLSPSQVSLLVLIESVLGPIWVWLFINESITVYEMFGGLIVLGAVILQTVKGDESERPGLQKTQTLQKEADKLAAV